MRRFYVTPMFFVLYLACTGTLVVLGVAILWLSWAIAGTCS